MGELPAIINSDGLETANRRCRLSELSKFSSATRETNVAYGPKSTHDELERGFDPVRILAQAFTEERLNHRPGLNCCKCTGWLLAAAAH